MAIQAQLYQENPGFPWGGSQDPMTEFNGRFSAQQKNLLSQHEQRQVLLQELQSLNQRNGTVWRDDTAMIPTMFDQVENKQRLGIDQYIEYQSERLRIMIEEQRDRQLALIMKRVEPELQRLLREKEEEIYRATKRTTELQALLMKTEAENQTWRRIARESEAMVSSLKSSLERVNSLRFSGNNVATADDAESCCDLGWSANMADRRHGGSGGDGICRSCGCRRSSVLFLPCRHFCTCEACERFLVSCPVCGEPKKAIIETVTF